MPIQRLKRRADFQRLTRARRSWAARGLVLQAAAFPDDAAPAPVMQRVGFTASRKVGNAVRRNRAKRRLRALAEELLPARARGGYDYVLVARQATVDRAYDRLKADLEYALGKLKLLKLDARPDADPAAG